MTRLTSFTLVCNMLVLSGFGSAGLHEFVDSLSASQGTASQSKMACTCGCTFVDFGSAVVQHSEETDISRFDGKHACLICELFSELAFLSASFGKRCPVDQVHAVRTRVISRTDVFKPSIRLPRGPPRV